MPDTKWNVADEKDIGLLADTPGLRIDRSGCLLLCADSVAPCGLLAGLIVSLLAKLAESTALGWSLPGGALELDRRPDALCLTLDAVAPSGGATLTFKVVALAGSHLLVLMYARSPLGVHDDPEQLRVDVSDFVNADAGLVRQLSLLRSRLDRYFFAPLRRSSGAVPAEPTPTPTPTPAPTRTEPPSTRQPAVVRATGERLRIDEQPRPANPYLLPPRPFQPTPPVGSHDLFPGAFYPGPYPADGGGMLVGPNHPLFQPSPFGPAPGRPSGPRFDPTSPFSFPDEPPPDHLAPPPGRSPFY